jgi:hypothetical protein
MVFRPQNFKEPLTLLADLIEKGHCIGTSAENIDGKPVAPSSPDACRFCVIGGIMRVNHELNVDYGALTRWIGEYIEHKDLGSKNYISRFSDTTPTGQLVQILRDASNGI